MKIKLSIFLVVLPFLLVAQFAPPAGWEGSTAINADDPAFVGWATGCQVERGLRRIDKPQYGYASYGVPEDALGKADDTLLVSLGDGGNAVCTFASPICDGPGYDFAVFENPLKWAEDTTLYFLELGFVEVSSDGENYVRFPSVSMIPTETQVGTFDCTDPRMVHNLAGKYAPHWGTPFDLAELAGNELLDINHVTHVRIVDVVGTINPEYASYDSEGHIINDPWPTPFESSGFDLDAIGVIHDLAHNEGVDELNRSGLIYPMPVKNTLSVMADKVESITVFSLMGQKYLETEGDSIEVSTLPSGVYLARIVADGKVMIERFIKE